MPSYIVQSPHLFTMPFIHWVMRSGMKAGLSIQPLHSCRTLAIPMPGLWYRFVIVSDFVYLLQYNCDTGLYLYLFLYLLQHKLWYRFVFVSVFCICYVWMTKYVLFKHPHQEDGRMEVFAQREIKKGEEVFIAWMMMLVLLVNRKRHPRCM